MSNAASPYLQQFSPRPLIIQVIRIYPTRVIRIDASSGKTLQRLDDLRNQQRLPAVKKQHSELMSKIWQGLLCVVLGGLPMVGMFALGIVGVTSIWGVLFLLAAPALSAALLVQGISQVMDAAAEADALVDSIPR